MKANELRIGNWVQRPLDLRNDIIDGGRIYFPIDHVMIRDCDHYRDNWAFEPIPLTPKILEAAGFHKFNNAWVLSDYDPNNHIKWFFSIWNQFDGVYSYNGEMDLELTSLHQLQNLYYALTGEELTISINSITK